MLLNLKLILFFVTEAVGDACRNSVVRLASRDVVVFAACIYSLLIQQVTCSVGTFQMTGAVSITFWHCIHSIYLWTNHCPCSVIYFLHTHYIIYKIEHLDYNKFYAGHTEKRLINSYTQLINAYLKVGLGHWRHNIDVTIYTTINTRQLMLEKHQLVYTDVFIMKTLMSLGCKHWCLLLKIYQ